MRRIASRQNPIVARYRLAARGDADGIMLLDGVHVVSDAIAAGARVREAAVAAASMDDPLLRGVVDHLVGAGVDVASVTAPVMAALSGVRSSSAIVALADRPGLDEGDVFAGAGARAPLVIVAIDVQDPGNVGAIIRAAEAGGATGVVVAGSSADPFGWKALRGSMGSAFRLPVLRRQPAEDVQGGAGGGDLPLLDVLRRHHCQILATAPRGGRPLYEADLLGATAILIGGEGPGLRPEVLGAADERVSIPMESPVESLNAAATAAIMVYEARRQRSRVCS